MMPVYTITVLNCAERHEFNFQAFVSDRPDIIGFGVTRKEAIGDLLVQNQEFFSVFGFRDLTSGGDNNIHSNVYKFSQDRING